MNNSLSYDHDGDEQQHCYGDDGDVAVSPSSKTTTVHPSVHYHHHQPAKRKLDSNPLEQCSAANSRSTFPQPAPPPLILHPGHGSFMFPKKVKRSKSSFSSVTFAAAADDETAKREDGCHKRSNNSGTVPGDNADDDEPEYVSILVGYAFGPKKMSTMGLIMAEASNMVEELTDLQPRCVGNLCPPSVHDEEHFSNGDIHNEERSEEHCNIGRSTSEASLQNLHGVQDDPTLITFESRRERLKSEHGKSSLEPHTTMADCHTVATNDASSMWEGSKHNYVNEDRSAVDAPSNTKTKKPKQQQFRVSFVPLDLDYPLEEQHGGKFDAILHKLTEDLLTSMPPDSGTRAPIPKDEKAAVRYIQEAKERLQLLERYQTIRPSCCFVDPPDSVRRVLSRADIAHTLNTNLKGVTTVSGLPVSTPRYFVSTGTTTTGERESPNLLANTLLTFDFPIIAKPLTAAGTSESHKMMIILNRRGLHKLSLSKQPTLLQEYANHGGKMFKVYVLGEDVRVFQRPSLPDLPKGEVGLSDGSKVVSHLDFDSQKPYPKLSDFGCVDVDVPAAAATSSLTESKQDGEEDLSLPYQKHGRTKVDDVNYEEAVTADEVRPVAKAIRKAFGLDLFGFDILLTTEEEDNDGETKECVATRKLLVVDINYFPSYKEVSNFPFLLAQYLTQRAINSRFHGSLAR